MRTCPDHVASVVKIDSGSISTTLTIRKRHVHDQMETRLKQNNDVKSVPLVAS